METIGEISEIRTETVFEWEVKDLFSLRDAIDTRYDSPEFQCFGISWKLQLYPNGDSRFGAADDWVGVDLIRSFSGCPVTMDYSFTLKSSDRSTDRVNVIYGGVLDKNNGRRGFSELIRRSELMERKAVYAPSDEITIICTLTLRPDMVSRTAAIEYKTIRTVSYLTDDVSLKNLSEDFSKFWDTGLYYDVEVRCGEHTVKAHKIVLCARSEVFKAKLETDLQEGRTGNIQVLEAYANYFQDFIRYLYTALLPELTFKKAKSLYGVGGIYAVKSPMHQCSEYLQDNISTENAFECLVLADAHSDQKLEEGIITYILDKKLYLQDEYWAPFCDSFPKVAIKVYKLSHRKTEGHSEKKMKVF